MSTAIRYFVLLVCAMDLVIAAAFFFQWPVATSLWPLEGTTPLTFILLASFFAAAGASTLWPVLSGNEGALAAVGLDYLTILGLMAAYTLRLGLRGGSAGLVGLGVVCAGGALFGLWLVLWGRRLPMDTSILMPAPVRWSFVLFVVALLFASGRLLLQMPTIPWKLTPELSMIAGFMFLGAAVYFVYGLLRPSWSNAAGQLCGFLAYDLVLIVPFLRALPGVAPQFRAGLIIYLVVVIYSGLLAIYFLFVNKRTRIPGQSQTHRDRSNGERFGV